MDWIYNATARCMWWRVSAAGLRLHAVGREREEGSRAAGVRRRCVGRVRPSPLYIEGGRPALSPPPSLGPSAKGGRSGGQGLSPLLEAPIRVSPCIGRLSLWGLVPLAQC